MLAERDAGIKRKGNDPLQLKNAEREYIHAVYLEHYQALRSYAAGLGFRGEAAEDLLQETFLTAIRRVEALRECKNQRAYLIRILRNHIGYQLRSMKYAAAVEVRLLFAYCGCAAREIRDDETHMRYE